MTELEIYTLFNSGRLVGVISYIGSIVPIQVALRVANLIRENAGSNLIQKNLATMFAL